MNPHRASVPDYKAFQINGGDSVVFWLEGKMSESKGRLIFFPFMSEGSVDNGCSGDKTFFHHVA